MESLVDLEGRNPSEDIGQKDCIDAHTETLTLEESQNSESKGTQWTDEKHCLYLKSMEASFVNQLYGSLDLFGWHSQNKCSWRPKYSRRKHTTTSGQYKVFQDGGWTKIDFRRDKPQLKKANESGNLLTSPWIKHYACPCSHQMEVNSDGLAETQNQNFTSKSSHQDFISSITDSSL